MWDGDAGPVAAVPVLPDPVARDEERVLARWGLLGEGAVPVFTPGARYPMAGLAAAGGGPRGLRPVEGRVLRADRDVADVKGLPRRAGPIPLPASCCHGC